MIMSNLPTTTQARHPWRATVRTLFQGLVSLAVIAPLIVSAIEEATGWDVEGVPFVAFVLAGLAALARVMAIPGVEAWLRRFVPFLAAGVDGEEVVVSDV